MVHLDYSSLIFWSSVMALAGAFCGVAGLRQFLDQQYRMPLHRALCERDKARADLNSLRCDYREILAKLHLMKEQIETNRSKDAELST